MPSPTSSDVRFKQERMGKKFRFSLLALVATGIAAAPLRAQLVREDKPSQAPQGKGIAQKPEAAAEQAPPGKRRISQEIQLIGEQLWSDTGIDVQPGEHIVVTASGKMRYADAKEDNGPEGIPRGFKDLLRILPFNGAGRGALMGRVGDAEIAQPFLLGAHRDVVAPVAGPLAIGINQVSDDTGDGTYTVRIDILAPDSGTAYRPARQVKSLSGVDANIWTKVPRRVADKNDNPGDMVNFLLLGSEDAMQKVFTAAGWVKVDADVRGTVLRGIIGSISKESYLTMPMSP